MPLPARGAAWLHDRPAPEEFSTVAAARCRCFLGTTRPQLDYRPDIDGLRAVAIAAVVVFHAFPAAARGGFTGVDVFFVISGYLISRIIWRGLDARSFTLAWFYGRRVLRLFPALVLVLVGQFYLVFPLLLIAAHRSWRSAVHC